MTLAAYRYSTGGFYGMRDAVIARDREQFGLSPELLDRRRSEFQITLNQPLGDRYGSLYLMGSRYDYWNRPDSNKQFSFGYSNRWRSFNYSVSAMRTYDMQGRSDNQYLFGFSLPLGGRSGGSWRPTSMNGDIGMSNDRYQSSRIGITGAAGVDRNISYGVTLSDRAAGGTSAMANAEYRGRYTTVNGAYSHGQNFRQASLGGSGMVMLHAGGITLAPQRGDTMVLVEAPAARGAGVNYIAGLRIDGRGYAVVPYVSPYRMNTVRLDPEGMSMDVELSSSSQMVAPYAGAISKLSFETREGRALLINGMRASGEPLPFGAQVYDAQGQVIGMVGQAGQMYIRSNDDNALLQVKWGGGPGQQCRVSYQLDAAGAAAANNALPHIEAQCI